MRRKRTGITLLAEAGEKIEQDKKTSGRDKIELSLLDEYTDNEGTTNSYLVGEVNEENTANILKGIKENGFHGAIDVWKMPNGRYMIFSGHRRAFAMKTLGNTVIPCNIYEKPEAETESRLWYLRANIHTRGSANASSDGGHIYIARQMEYLAGIIKMTGEFRGSDTAMNKMIADEFDTSYTIVWRYRQLLKMSPRLVEAEAEGHIPLKQAAALSVIDKEYQDIVLDGVSKAVNSNNPLNRDNIEKIISEIKEIDSPEATDNNDEKTSKASYAAAIVSAVLEQKMNEKENNHEADISKATPAKKKTYKDTFINNLHGFEKKMDKLQPEEINEIRMELEYILTAINNIGNNENK